MTRVKRLFFSRYRVNSIIILQRYTETRVLEDRIGSRSFFGGLYRIVDPFFPEDRDRIVDPKNQGSDRKGSDFFQILFLENMSE